MRVRADFPLQFWLLSHLCLLHGTLDAQARHPTVRPLHPKGPGRGMVSLQSTHPLSQREGQSPDPVTDVGGEGKRLKPPTHMVFFIPQFLHFCSLLLTFCPPKNLGLQSLQSFNRWLKTHCLPAIQPQRPLTYPTRTCEDDLSKQFSSLYFPFPWG